MSSIIKNFERTVSELTKGTTLFGHQVDLVERMKNEMRALELLEPDNRESILNAAKMEAGVCIRADQDEISEYTIGNLVHTIFSSGAQTASSSDGNTSVLKIRRDFWGKAKSWIRRKKDEKPTPVEATSYALNNFIIGPEYPLASWGENNRDWVLWWEIQQHKLWLLSAYFKKWSIADSNEQERPRSVYEQQIAEYMTDPEIRMVVTKFIDRSKVKVANQEEKFFIAGKYKEIYPSHSFITPKNASREILDDADCPQSLKSCTHMAAVQRVVRVVKLYQEMLANNELNQSSA